jgi:hypothetical protein
VKREEDGSGLRTSGLPLYARISLYLPSLEISRRRTWLTESVNSERRLCVEKSFREMATVRIACAGELLYV